MEVIEIETSMTLDGAACTRTWLPAEFVHVGETGLVYDWDSKRRMVVRMPGGTSALAEDLIRRKRNVRMPRLLRGQPALAG